MPPDPPRLCCFGSCQCGFIPIIASYTFEPYHFYICSDALAVTNLLLRSRYCNKCFNVTIATGTNRATVINYLL